MAPERFTQIYQCRIKSRTITKYCSNLTGLTVTHIDCPGPIVKGFFTLVTEEDSDDGLPHTLEHLIFLGSELYPFKGVLDLAANHCMSEGTNAWTAIDHTCYTVETAGSDGFITLLPIYLDHILFPTLSDEAFQTEVHHVNGSGDDAGVVYCEMQARENNAESREERALQHVVFTNHCGYSCETGGIMKNLRESCNNAKVRAYHKRFYRPENLDVIICGAVDISKVFESIISIDDRAGKVSYGEYIKPWQGKVEHFTTYITKDVLVPAKDEDNGRVSVTWKGPQLLDITSCEATSAILTYLTQTSAAPLVKALIDIPEPLCSRASWYYEEYPTTVITMTCKGVKPGKHGEVKEVMMRTIKETAQGDIDMDRLRNQIKNSLRNFSDSLENDPTQLLASVVINDLMYGGEDNEFLSNSMNAFEVLGELLKKDQKFWKDFLQTYTETPNVTINAIPSIKCMEDLESEEKARIQKQQNELGPEGLKKCGEAIKKCIEFNEKGEDALEEIIDELPSPEIDEGISFHPVTTVFNKDSRGLIKHAIDSEFVRFYMVCEAELSSEEKVLLGIYATLYGDTALKYNDTELSFEEAIKMKEQLLLNCNISVCGNDFGSLSEAVLMSFKFDISDIDECTNFIKSLVCCKVFTPDRISTAINKLSSTISTNLRKARVVLDALNSIVRFSGSCSSCRNPFSEGRLLESWKDDVPPLITKLEDLQKKLFTENVVSLHIVSNKGILEKHFSGDNLEAIRRMYRVDKDVITCKLPSVYRRTTSEPQQILKVVPTDESSYLVVTRVIDAPYNHPDYIAIALFAEYIGQLEGVFWKQIRGAGFAYSYYITNSPVAGNLVFYLGRATNISKGYLAAKETVDNIVKDKELDEMQIETAKGALACGIIQKYETPADSAMTNLLNLHKGLPLSQDTDNLTRIKNVTEAQLLEVAEKYFQPLFTKDSTVVVCCPDNKKDDIVSDLSNCNLNLKIVEDVLDYIDHLENDN